MSVIECSSKQQSILGICVRIIKNVRNYKGIMLKKQARLWKIFINKHQILENITLVNMVVMETSMHIVKFCHFWHGGWTVGSGNVRSDKQKRSIIFFQ